MRQSRWHYTLAAELEALVHKLEYQGKDVATVSEQFSKVLIAYERGAPTLSLADSESKKGQGRRPLRAPK